MHACVPGSLPHTHIHTHARTHVPRLLCAVAASHTRWTPLSSSNSVHFRAYCWAWGCRAATVTQFGLSFFVVSESVRLESASPARRGESQAEAQTVLRLRHKRSCPPGLRLLNSYGYGHLWLSGTAKATAEGLRLRAYGCSRSYSCRGVSMGAAHGCGK
jgi:hypothetical protein